MQKFLLQISLAFVTIFSISDSIIAQCPTINSQPVSQYDCEDNSIRMIVGVTGSPTFQWQRKLPSETVFSNIAGATLDNYQVYQQIFTQAPTGTQYKVILSANSCANVTSNPATVTYHTFESIINDPVCIGKNYALTIPITATSQSYVSGYQWERLVSGGVWTTAVNSGSLSGVTTATLNFSNIPQIEDGVKYRCNVVFQVSPNNDNNGSVTNSDQIPTCPRTSPEASIQIKSLSPIPIPTSLIIKGCLGGSVTSVTKTLKSAGCTGTTRWYTQANALVGSSTTGDFNVTQTATGLYYYYATCDQNGCESTKSADVELQINAFPAAPTNAGTPTTACQGDNVIFKASGGTYNIWYSTPVTGGLISTAQTITVNNVQPTNASTAAILTRYVSQKVTSTTCESLTRTKIDVTVNPTTAIVTQPTNLTICEGGTASFTLSATGVGLNYQWKKGTVDVGTNSSTLNFTNVNISESGTYTCVVTGTCGTITSNAVSLTVTAKPIAPTVSSPLNYCQNATNVALSATGSGLLWYGAATGGTGNVSPPTPSTIAVATQSFWVSQTVSSCESPRSKIDVTITENPTASAGLGATITGTQLYSLSGVTTAQSGTPAYTYAWSSTPVVTISPNANASNPSFGTFTQNTQINLTVYDSKGCTSNSSANVIVQNCNLAVSIAGNTDFCEGSSTILTANVANQNGTVSYQWKKGMTDLGTVSTQTVSDAGNYSVNIADSFCTANASIIITKTSPPTPVALGASGCVNAAVSLSATNCISGTLLWFKATDNTSVTMPLTVGNAAENFYAKCKIGTCESPKSNIVGLSPTTNTSPTLSFITEKCLSATSILPNSFTPNGGVFSISPSIGTIINSSTGEVTFSQSGTYNITYNVTGSCATGSAVASIIINPLPTASAGLGAAITGTQLYSLSGVTTAQSGTPSYTYAWSSTPVVTISPNATASNPSFGTFTQNTQINLTVYDSKGCTSNSSANVITQACSLTANITSTGSLCSTGNSSMILTANLTGGIAPISYSWKRGATIIGSNLNVTISEPDTYSVIVTDGNGCSETVSTTVSQNSLAAPQVAGVTIRGSGTATLIATNCSGTSVNWYDANGQFLLNGFSYTTAEITGTTRYYAECVGSGCISSQTPVDVIFVSAPNSPQVSSALVCGAGSATISTSGCSGEIRWYYAQTATTYFATGGSVFFPNVTSTFDVYAECVVNATPSPRSRGIVTFQVPPVAWIQVIGNQAICKGQSVTLRSNNDPNVKAYLWKKDGVVLGKNDRDLVVTETGNYTVINSGDGCSSESSAQKVDVVALPNTPTVSSTKTMICQGDSTTISGAISGISSGKNWYKDGIIFSNKNTITISKSGEYKLAFTNYLGCESAQSTAIKIGILPVPTKPSIAIIGQAKFCEGTTIELISELATAYEWRNVKGDVFKTKNIVSISKSDTYFLKTKNSDGCTSAENSQEITVLPLPEKPVIKTEGNQEVCQGESLKIIAQKDANSYVWSTGENSKNITVKGVKAGIISYSLKVTDGNNCTSQPSDLLSITVNSLPAKPIISNNKNLAICAGESIELQSSLATKYEWNTGEKTQKISTQQTGKYTLKVSNDKGCFSENADSISVIQNPKPAKPIITASGATTFCSDTNIVLTSSVSDRYKWVSSEKTPNLKANKSGQYALTVFNQFGCESDISEIITVKVNPQPNRPNITPSAYVEFCEDKSITLTTTKNAKYLWSSGSTESSIEVNKSDKFWVKVSNEFGCQSEASPFLVTTVFALPATPNLDFSGVYNFKAFSTTTGKGYEWKLGENLLSDTTGIIKLNQNGVYSVRRASVFGVIPTVGFAYEELVCYSLPVSKTYNQNVDFGGMAVYPNPVQNDYFLLETSDNLIDATIILVNNKGEIYYEGIIPKLNKTYRLDIRNIPNGNYLIILKASDFNAIKHLMISR